MYKEFNRASCAPVKVEVLDALAGFADKHGIAVDVVGQSYGGDHMIVKVQISLKDASGNAQTREASDFIDYAEMGAIRCRSFRKLTPDHLWQTFTVRSETYKIIGYKPRATRRPIIGERSDGKQFVFPVATVCDALRIPMPETA